MQMATVPFTRWEILQMSVSWEIVRTRQQQRHFPAGTSCINHGSLLLYFHVSRFQHSDQNMYNSLLKTKTNKQAEEWRMLNILYSQWTMMHVIPHFVLFIVWLLKSRHAAALGIFTACSKTDFFMIKILHFLHACLFLSTILLFC